jgi:hypothetical protein
MVRSATTGPAPPILATRLALTAREAADALGITERTLWSLSEPRGPIPSFRIGPGGRSIRYSVAALQTWIAAQIGDDQVGSLTTPTNEVD